MIPNFRAWDKQYKRMSDTDGIFNQGTGDEYTLYLSLSGVLFVGYMTPIGKRMEMLHGEAKDRYIIMQSAGLPDKNRTEIFAGDIVKDQKGIANVGVVFRHRNKFMIEWQMRSWGGTRPTTDNDEAFEYAEIIGNIHANPELLKQED